MCSTSRNSPCWMPRTRSCAPAAVSMIAVYRPDLSYAADKINLAKMRFFSIETVRFGTRPGTRSCGSWSKTLIAGAEKSGDNQPVATYQVVSGGAQWHISSCWSRWNL